MITIKRSDAEPSEADGFRVLVDRLWPRGMTKEKARVYLWLKEIAPTTELRKWFGRDLKRWPDFVERYPEELKAKSALLPQFWITCIDDCEDCRSISNPSEFSRPMEGKFQSGQNPGSRNLQ